MKILRFLAVLSVFFGLNYGVAYAGSYTVTYHCDDTDNSGYAANTGETFTLDGGESHTIKSADYIGCLPNGFDFAGWYDNATHTTYAAGDTLSTTNQNVDLYATYTPQCLSVTFDNARNGYEYGISSDSNFTVYAYSRLDTDNPDMVWYQDSECSQPIANISSYISQRAPNPTGGATFYGYSENLQKPIQLLFDASGQTVVDFTNFRASLTLYAVYCAPGYEYNGDNDNPACNLVYTVRVWCSTTERSGITQYYSTGDEAIISDIIATPPTCKDAPCGDGNVQNGWDVFTGDDDHLERWGSTPINPDTTIIIGSNPNATTITIMPHCVQTSCPENYYFSNGSCVACDSGFTAPAGSTDATQCTKTCSVECINNYTCPENATCTAVSSSISETINQTQQDEKCYDTTGIEITGQTCEYEFTCSEGYTKNSTQDGCDATPTCNYVIRLISNGGTPGNITMLYRKNGSDNFYSDSTCTTEYSTPSEVIPTRDGYTFRGFYATQYNDVNSDSATHDDQVLDKTGAATTYSYSWEPSGPRISIYAAWARDCNSSVSNGSCSLNVLTNGEVDYTTTCDTGYAIISGKDTYNPVCDDCPTKITLNPDPVNFTDSCSNMFSPTLNNGTWTAPVLPNTCEPEDRNGYSFGGYKYGMYGMILYDSNLEPEFPIWQWCDVENMELTVLWEGMCRLIEFNDNNGSSESVNADRLLHKKVGDTAWYGAWYGADGALLPEICGKQTWNPEVSVPHNDNATFDGYYTELNQTGIKIFDAGGQVTHAGDNWVIEPNDSYTLYAHWVCNDGYEWNDNTQQCEQQKPYRFQLYCDAIQNVLGSETHLVDGQSLILSQAELLKQCGNVDPCGEQQHQDGWNLYLDDNDTPYNNLPLSPNPTITITGGGYNGATLMILAPNCVADTTSVTYKCWSGDTDGKVDDQVTLTNYAVKEIPWYNSCVINQNQNSFEVWKFSGDDSLWPDGENWVIQEWTWDENQTFVPAYPAKFSCDTTYWTSPSNGATGEIITVLGENMTMPAMNCVPRQAYEGWVDTDNAKWTSAYDNNLVTPVTGASCTAGNITATPGDTFAWDCPTDLLFKPEDKLIEKTVTISCGESSSHHETFTMTHENQAMIQQDIIDWFHSQCGGPCSNPTDTYHQGYSYKKVCAEDWGQQDIPNTWTQMESSNGLTCYKTPENTSIQAVFNSINMANITGLNITGMGYCPKYVNYKCSDGADYSVYREPPYAVYDKSYMPLTHTAAGCESGFVFDKWKVEGENNYYDENVSVDNWPYNTEITLVAQWGNTGNVYTINYENMDQATPQPPVPGMPITYTYGVGETINATPSRQHSEFLGWCTDVNLEHCAPTQTIGTTETGPKTFWAKWECVSPYHMTQNGQCEPCKDPNTYWDEDTQQCLGCPNEFPRSLPPYNWSIDQCYRPCSNGARCDSSVGSVLNGLSSSASYTLFPEGNSGKQIEFKGNVDARVDSCDASEVPYCAVGVVTTSAVAYKPVSEQVDFHGMDNETLGNRYIFGTRTGDSDVNIGNADAWCQIVGPAQKYTVGAYTHTHILYPADTAPNAEVSGYEFKGYYNPRQNGTQYVESNYTLDAANAERVRSGISGNLNTTRDLYARYIPCETNEIWENGTCEPCEAGYQPNAAGTACEPCPTGTAGMGGTCEPCEDGYQPNATGTACEPCPAGTYGTGGSCTPCGENYSSAQGSTSINDCFLVYCSEDGYHLNHGQCEPDEIDCDAPYATTAIRTWNPTLGAYGSCQIVKCDEDYHIASNACVPDSGDCIVANGRGKRAWNNGAWDICDDIQCDPGYDLNGAGTECQRCSNYIGSDGQPAVSSYITGCEIASCMYQGQKYALEGDECIPICQTVTDDGTGSKHWDERTKKCIRTCNPGYKMW